MAAVKKLMLIGKVVKKLAPKISMIEVQTNALDEVLCMYFARYNLYKADDGPHNLKVDDYVLIRDKVQPDRVDLIYEVGDIVRRAGQATDPFTGKRIVANMHTWEYLEDMQRIDGLLPDRGQCQAGLKYSEEDITVGSPQSPRDHS